MLSNEEMGLRLLIPDVLSRSDSILSSSSPFRNSNQMPAPSHIPASFDSVTASARPKISWQTFVPTGPYSRAVVIAYGSAGMSPDYKPSIEEHAKQLAAAGILSVIPDYFQLNATPHGSPWKLA